MPATHIEGETLYTMYLKVFGTIFAPRWRDLTDESRAGWARLEREYRTLARCGNSYPELAGREMEIADAG